MKPPYFLITILILSTGCISSKTYKAGKSYREGDFEFVLLNSKFDNRILGHAKAIDLTQSDVAFVKLLLNLARNGYNHTITDSNKMIRPFSSYKLQWVPFENAKGEKEIWINGLCNPFDNYFGKWKRGIIVVKDGGNCYFQMRINLTTETYADITVNGRT
jgi:hypothetical protein